MRSTMQGHSSEKASGGRRGYDTKDQQQIQEHLCWRQKNI